jgi:phospholipid transport system substrate-binding protein
VREGGVEKLLKTLGDKNRALAANDKKAAGNLKTVATQ